VPLNPKSLHVDSGLLLDSELSYFSKYMKVLRLKAQEIGYGNGTGGNIHDVGWFDLGNYDPMINDEVKIECLRALNPEESRVIVILHEIIEKAVRLTKNLSDEEKRTIREYKEAVHQSTSDLADLRHGYRQIMVKHGEKVFEQ
jgi:hypothetical protein